MEWAFVIVALGAFSALGVVIWRQQKIIERMSEMLAARSYGEFCSGQAKVATAKPKRTDGELDPGF